MIRILIGLRPFFFFITFGGVAVSWRSVKQSYIANSTMEAEYVAASEATKEAIWLRKFLMEVKVVPLAVQPMILFCDTI